jgi:hypothetical protein
MNYWKAYNEHHLLQKPNMTLLAATHRRIPKSAGREKIP